MVSFKPRSISKHDRVASDSLSRPKRQWLGRTPSIRASRQEIVKKPQAALPRLLSTLRLPMFAKHSWTSDVSSGVKTNRRIIRVSALKFESVSKPPIVIPGPSIASVCMPSGSMQPIQSPSIESLSVDPVTQGSIPRSQNSAAIDPGPNTLRTAGDDYPIQNISSAGSFGSWVEVSQPGSRPAVRITAESCSTSASLLHGSGELYANSSEDPPRSVHLVQEDFITSSYNEESFIRTAEADLGW